VPRRAGLTSEATDDLIVIRRWQLQPGSGRAAKRRVQAILRTIEGLRRHPCLYVPGGQPGTREVSSEGHRIVYVVDTDTGGNADAGDVPCCEYSAPASHASGFDQASLQITLGEVARGDPQMGAIEATPAIATELAPGQWLGRRG
jgi:plasmid stabilization system protein ParE